jgi:hypothetical protein
MASRVMIETKHSTRLSQEHPVGVKCRVILGVAGEPGAGIGVLVRGVVVAGRVCLRHPAGANISEDQGDVQSGGFYIGACL